MTRISIMMYHQVGRFPRPDAHRASFCRVDRFRLQMAYLKGMGYRVLGLEEVLDHLASGRPLPRRSVALTFDDGYRNFAEQAAPVLRRHGFPATVFLVADLIGKRTRWLEREGRTAYPLMDLDTLKGLRGTGVTFGSHTLTHPFLSELGPAAKRREIVESRRRLEELLEEPVRFFCYPDGDFDAEAVAIAREAGYAGALTCIRGSAVPGDDPFLLPRKAVSYGDSLAGFVWKLHMKHRKKTPPEPAS